MWDTVFTYTALIGGTVLAFQFVLMWLGLGSDGDLAVDGADLTGGVDAGGIDVAGADVGTHITADQPNWHEAADADMGHPGAHWFYEMLSLRTLGAATTFFGLAGMTARVYGYSQLQALVAATIAGAGSLWIVYWLFKQVYKLQNSGNENVRNAIGALATVYVPIPAKRSAAGKVTFRMQNRLVEYQAVTDDEDRLKTGEKVVVVGVVNSETVRVARTEKVAQDANLPVTNIASSV